MMQASRITIEIILGKNTASSATCQMKTYKTLSACVLLQAENKRVWYCKGGVNVVQICGYETECAHTKEKEEDGLV